MEVHKHPHHVTHKKQWGEYLLEFFMLFLAVFLGFLAENVREGISDKQKEKEYMTSLSEDLSKDTTAFNQNLARNHLLIKGEDSILTLLGSNLQDRHIAEMALIYYLKYGLNLAFITITDRTISQLKNNGGMRLIRKKNVANKIIEYYNGASSFENSRLLINDYYLQTGKMANTIFNIMANRAIIDSFMTSSSFGPRTPIEYAKSLLSNSGNILLTNERNVIAPFMGNIEFTRGLMMGYIINIQDQMNQAIELIKLLNNEYNLKNNE